MAFNFGGTKPFGAATTTASTGLFGATQPSTSAFGFSGFGSTAAVAPTPAFGTSTGTATTSATGFGTGFGFGSTGTGTTGGLFGTGTSTSGGLFGTTTNTTASSGFSFGTGTGSAFGGTNTLGGAGTFKSGLGSTTGFGSTLGGFGQNKSLTQPATLQQTAAASLANMATAVSLPLIFGDERDALIAKWNQLQAFWGTGKGYYNQQGAVVDFQPDNPFCRFKAVGYSCLPTSRNKDGLVCLIFDKKLQDVEANQLHIVDVFTKALGSKPNLSVCVEGVRALPQNQGAEMIVYVQERSAAGTTRRIPATELFNFLNRNNIQQLNLGMVLTRVMPKIGLSVDQLKQYLENPPAGIDPLLWQQAKLDNPDPDKLIPVPMIGFSELHNRLKHQEHQTHLYQARIDMIQEDISKLQQSHADQLAKIEQYKRKFLEQSHRVLQVAVRQEVYRKQGYAIQVDEEQLRVQLEAIQAELNAPMQFKGRLNELMSQMRMQNHILGGSGNEATYQMDGAVQQELFQHLKQQQHGIQHLIDIIKTDLEDLHLIEQGLGEASVRRS